MWVGITKSWLGNFPNPLEIAGALNDCMSQAAGETIKDNLVPVQGAPSAK